MPLLIPVSNSESTMIERRMSIQIALNVTSETRGESAPIALQIDSGDGVIVFVDAISPVLDAAR